MQRLHAENKVLSPRQQFHAAFIFHHSKRPAHYKTAQELASAAAAARELKQDYVVQWLAKASYDRWMLSLGKPQKYGTQGGFSLSVK